LNDFGKGSTMQALPEETLDDVQFAVETLLEEGAGAITPRMVGELLTMPATTSEILKAMLAMSDSLNDPLRTRYELHCPGGHVDPVSRWQNLQEVLHEERECEYCHHDYRPSNRNLTVYFFPNERIARLNRRRGEKKRAGC
jgi:hypothetical protein